MVQRTEGLHDETVVQLTVFGSVGSGREYMASFRRFEEIIAWQKARALRRRIAVFRPRFEAAKDWGFQRQIMDAALSVMNNIAEGFGRFRDREFAKFLGYSRSSAFEVQSMFYAGEDDGYFSPEERAALHAGAEEVVRLISALIVTLGGEDDDREDRPPRR